MTPFQRCLGVLVLIVFCGGCLRVTTDITTFEQFQEYREDDPDEIRVMTTDKSIYELERFAIRDSVLEGSGRILTGAGHSAFKGALPLSNIVYIQGRESSFGRTLLGLTFVGFVGLAAGNAGSESGLSVYRPSSGSCPYVYAWDGSSYVLQGEVFGTAFGKALESTTACMLPATSPRDNAVLVKVTNERPETHYIDAMRLLAFEAPEGARVLLDNAHRAWPVLNPQPPSEGPTQILSPDGLYWRSDLHHAAIGSGYRDTVELVFPRARNSNEGSLIIHAVNTRLCNAVYDMVFGYLDNDCLRFLHQVEHDPTCVEALQEWIHEASLTVEVWRQGRWVREGRIVPEAIAVDIARIIRISSEGAEGNSVRVRFTALADLWKLDAAALDWTPVQPLVPHRMSMRSASHTAASSVSARLSTADKDYALLLPGENIAMQFERFHPAPGHTVSYALEATGYLYEWPPESYVSLPTPFQIAAAGLGWSDRLDVVNFLIRHREVLLPLVYERWKDVRASEPG